MIYMAVGKKNNFLSILSRLKPMYLTLEAESFA
jgi:hypothetical protein